MQTFANPQAAAQAIVDQVGHRIVLGLPLGLGKPNQLVNALYQLARDDNRIELLICTALSLDVPAGSAGMERRFLAPLEPRLWPDFPALDYVTDQRQDALPPNVEVREFFLRTGAYLGNANAQQTYVSTNYTHAVRDLLALGINVIGQIVAPPPNGHDGLSLSCNPDMTLEMLPDLRRRRESGEPVLFVGQINRQLPWMGNDAVLAASEFDLLLDDPALDFEPFAMPDAPLGIADYAIGLHAASLVRDGGTLQIGIGSLGDAVCHMLCLRHAQPDLFKRLCEIMIDDPWRQALPVETGRFEQGLLGSSEMVVPGFLRLRRAGILSRLGYADLATQQQADRGDAPDATGHYLYGGFFLGPKRFYQTLRTLPDDERAGINMTGIRFVNELFGDEALKRAQRRHARFLNNAMMVTLTGAVISDGLEDGRVISGVGGQYNFVAMAHELEQGRSVILLPSTRVSGGERQSNIVWNYGHTTIPRHLRDVVVTEYGAVDLRGKPDQDVIAAMLSICDAAFAPELLEQAKTAGKIPADYQLPSTVQDNTPEQLHERLLTLGGAEAFPHFPDGSDFTDTEARLAVALGLLKARQGNRRALLQLMRQGFRHRHDFADELARMDFDGTLSWRDRLQSWALLGALAESLADQRPLSGDQIR